MINSRRFHLFSLANVAIIYSQFDKYNENNGKKIVLIVSCYNSCISSHLIKENYLGLVVSFVSSNPDSTLLKQEKDRENLVRVA